MSTISIDRTTLKKAALQLYDERLKTELEASHLGEVIAIAPESGTYVLGKDFTEVDTARQTQLPNQLVYIFRVGGGGAVRIGCVQRHGRIH